MRHWVIKFFVILGFVSGTCLSAWSAGSLSFTSFAQVENDRVTLFDLVDQKSDLTVRVKARLKGQTVLTRLRPGREKYVTGQRIRALIRNASLPTNISVLIPAKVAIRRASKVYTTGQMIEAYRNALMDRLGEQSANVDIHDVSATRDVVVPQGRVDTRVNIIGGRLTGRVPANLEILVNGRKVKNVRVVGVVDLFGPAVVARNAISRNQIISPSDVTLERVNLSGLKGKPATSIEDVVGLSPTSAIAQGQTLSLNRLKRKPLIKRGEMVVMVCESHGMKITAKGKALQTGYKDSHIKLENPITKRKVYGKVLAQGRVKVEF